MRVAIVHYWLVGMWGGDRVVESLLDLFPDADIYTHVWRPEALPERVRARVRGTTFIDRLPGARRHYQKYLPLMPLALEQLDLTDYDLVISSEAGPAKGVITRPETLHLCYCHSPMRYAWNMYPEHMRQLRWPMRPIARLLMHRIRLWDRASADRVDRFIANSRTVADRIAKYYRRPSVVIHPPVAVERFSPAASPEGSYLHVGRLVPYKRADLAVEACSRAGLPLTVIGGGPEEARLRAMAGPTVRFLGRVSDPELARHYAECRALLFPGEEDFGIVPVEAMAAGKPVIAFGRGGAAETVLDGRTGLHFREQSATALLQAIRGLDRLTLAPEDIAAHAGAFGKDRFIAEMSAEVERARAALRRDGPLGPDLSDSAGAGAA